jgi:hypothetical protein
VRFSPARAIESQPKSGYETIAKFILLRIFSQLLLALVARGAFFMGTLLKIAGVILLCCISPFLIVLAPLFWWGGNASVTASHAVEDVTGSESAGNGCGWLIFGVLFAGFAFLVLAGLAVTMPEDCRTIVINQVMGRCP